MDMATFKSTLDKYGRDNLVEIIFDNVRTWLIKHPKLSDDPAEARRGISKRDENKNLVYTTFDEIVELDEANESIVKTEYLPGVDYDMAQKCRWKIVTHIEHVQGLIFLPADATDKEKQYILDHWDHTIT
jgi:hypothetical protein